MAKNNNLTDFLTDVANAIREKDGSTGTINPQDFSDKIKAIQTGVDTSDGNIEPTTVLKGYKGYAKGVAVNGAIETYDGTVEDVSQYKVTVTNTGPDGYVVEEIAVYESDTVAPPQELPDYATLLGRVPYNQSISFTVRKQYIAFFNTHDTVDTYSGGLTKIDESSTGNYTWFEVLGDGTVTATGYYCLTGDTLITLADLTQKRIDELTLQDKVLAIESETGKFVSDEITYTDSTEHKTFTEYDKWTFSDGTIVKTVHRHRLYNVEKQAMVYMDEWNVGEHAVNQNGEYIALVSHENVKEEVKHYTLFTKHQNYFANGLLSGNRYTAELHL